MYSAISIDEKKYKNVTDVKIEYDPVLFAFRCTAKVSKQAGVFVQTKWAPYPACCGIAILSDFGVFNTQPDPTVLAQFYKDVMHYVHTYFGRNVFQAIIPCCNEGYNTDKVTSLAKPPKGTKFMPEYGYDVVSKAFKIAGFTKFGDSRINNNTYNKLVVYQAANW